MNSKIDKSISFFKNYNRSLSERRRISTAFTLVELLVVISIIALLLAILMPSMQKAREQAKRVVCANNMRQLTLGFMMYADSYKGKLPPTTDLTNDSQTVFLKFMRSDTAGFYPSYMPSKDVFYCPNIINRGWGPEDEPYGYENWPYNVGYSIFIDKNVSVYPSRIMSVNVKGASMVPLASDIMCFDPSLNSWYPSPFVAHPGKKGDPAGGNSVYFDGHLIWLPYKAEKVDPRRPWERYSTRNWEGNITGSVLVQFVPRWD